MATEHIVKSFDTELTRLESKIAEMGGLAESQLAETFEALVKRDVEWAARIVERDHRVDEFENEVNTLAVRLLALRQPMADDLRAAVAAIKIAGDLERIGDYAKNIAKRIAAIADASPAGLIHSIERMGERVQTMVKTVLDAYVTRDADKATDVLAQDEAVDQFHTSLFRELLTYMMEDPRNIGLCTHLLFGAKNIERIGDHTTNIAENVYYLVHGTALADDRPKSDDTSSTLIRKE